MGFPGIVAWGDCLAGLLCVTCGLTENQNQRWPLTDCASGNTYLLIIVANFTTCLTAEHFHGILPSGPRHFRLSDGMLGFGGGEHAFRLLLICSRWPRRFGAQDNPGSGAAPAAVPNAVRLHQASLPIRRKAQVWCCVAQLRL